MVQLSVAPVRGAVEVLAPRFLTPSSRTPSSRESISPCAWTPDEVVHERFRIIRLLGEGRTGKVFEALDLERGCNVALRALRFGSPHGSWLSRLRHDVDLAKRLDHPNVRRTFDLLRTSPAGLEAPTFFLALELLSGETLEARLQSTGPLHPKEALPLLRGMAEGLRAAHRLGVVHGDFKTSKVLLVPGADGVGRNGGVRNGGVRPVLTGFGLAICADAPWYRGSPAYLAPEVVAGEAPTTASDVYAFGLVLHEMLTGTLLFRASTRFETARNRLVQDPPSLRRVRPDLPAAWSKVASRCLERFPEQRYAEGNDLAAALEHLERSGRSSFFSGFGRWMSKSG